MLRAGLLVDDALLPDLQLRVAHHRAPGVAVREAALLASRSGRDAEASARYCFGPGREL